jgi:hypothetical protein
MHLTLKDRIKRSVQMSEKPLFLREDFERFGSYRQVSRVLNDLLAEGALSRSGYGVYTKPQAPEIQNINTFVAVVKSRLGKRTRRMVSYNNVMVQLGERQASASRNAQSVLDDVKLRLAKAIVDSFDVAVIRSKSLENLEKWRELGAWSSALDEWTIILQKGNDDQVRDVMLGVDERANRLRQSPPYAGLLDTNTLKALREKIPA